MPLRREKRFFASLRMTRGGAQNDKGAVILRRGFSLSVILRRGSPSSVILRSFAPKNLSGHVFETGEKILRFAQNDKGTVILRSAATKNLSDHVSGTGGKILRFAQNDKGTVILRSESDEESFGPCLWDEREDSLLRSE